MSRVDLDALADLEEQRDFLLRSLDDLEAERAAGDIDDADYRTLRDDYTARAASVLRSIDEGKASLPRPRPRRPVRTLAVIAVTALLAVGAGLLVARQSDQRVAGETVTGDIRETNTRRLADARRLMGEGQAVEAVKRYDAVLADDPSNREALTYKGWLLALAGLDDEAIELLDRAIEVAPDYPDARVFRGLVLRRQGDLRGALAELDRFLADDPPPDFVGLVERARDEIRAELEGGGGTTTTQVVDDTP